MLLNEVTIFPRAENSRIQIINGFYNLIRNGREQFFSIISCLLTSSFLIFFLSSFAVIATAQIFGLFPVSGILHKDSSQLSFKFKSFRFIYSIIIQLGIALMFVTSIYKQLSNRIEYTKVGKEVYFYFYKK